MAKLINGNGNKAIWAAQDADLIASICGNITSIAAVGSQFSYTQEDANTIGVSDGVIITKEGRRIQLDTSAIDLFTIPTGVLGATSYYIIGYKLVQAANSSQTCETFVEKMDNSTDVIPEDTFKGGATEVYVSLYRVTQDGMNIDTVDLLLPKLSNVAQLSSDLDDIRREGFMPVLDYDSPLYTFSQTNISYTASKECYLVGTLGAGNLRICSISIDGKTPYTLKGQTNMNVQYSIPITKIGIGQVVSFTTNANDAALSSLFILDVVS